MAYENIHAVRANEKRQEIVWAAERTLLNLSLEMDSSVDEPYPVDLCVLNPECDEERDPESQGMVHVSFRVKGVDLVDVKRDLGDALISIGRAMKHCVAK